MGILGPIRRYVLFVVTAVSAAALAEPSAETEENVLMVLEYVANDKTVGAEISNKPGVYAAPRRGPAPPSWRLRPGRDVEGGGAPPERQVEFLHRSGETLESLCIVQVRYFRVAGNWRPFFRLDETPLFARDAAGRWRPLAVPGGSPALLQLQGSVLPNADGYYPRLEFSLTTGSAAIDSWVVR
jgi:hypothetical protein